MASRAEQMKKRSLVYCTEKPIIIDRAQWLNAHIGRISVGKKAEGKKFTILAYSDDVSDSLELRRFARENGALYIRSLHNSGVTAID